MTNKTKESLRRIIEVYLIDGELSQEGREVLGHKCGVENVSEETLDELIAEVKSEIKTEKAKQLELQEKLKVDQLRNERNEKVKKARKKKVAIGLVLGIVILAVGFVAFSAITEERKWTKTVETNTYTSYQSFMSEYPESSHVSDALSRQEKVFWEDALKTSTVESAGNYLAKYPNGRYLSEATELKEELMWKAAQTTSSINAFQDYVRAFPNGKYHNEVWRRLKELVLKPKEVGKQDYIALAQLVRLLRIENSIKRSPRYILMEGLSIWANGNHSLAKGKFEELREWPFSSEFKLIEQYITDFGTNNFGVSTIELNNKPFEFFFNNRAKQNGTPNLTILFDRVEIFHDRMRLTFRVKSGNRRIDLKFAPKKKTRLIIDCETLYVEDGLGGVLECLSDGFVGGKRQGGMFPCMYSIDLNTDSYTTVYADFQRPPLMATELKFVSPKNDSQPQWWWPFYVRPDPFE